ncbi:site-specific integrase [Pseudomonas extremaustralis]|uniref:site-specific integrase n=1 Tax=Pseudomonas extremaustralis TaxID=359110 RepID=UPI0021C5B778|nr:site-specific integrase [Pseudomonas extremaustralis]MDB1113852.1 site-specific integrase [Pseudomonas extremaustralis]UUJ38825.1 site-specific integrase [Pseudomonas extremaustralis]
MKRNPSYLTLNRHGTFYFRIVIPVSLRAILNGQREIRRTLKTDSRRLACKRARQYAARYEATFDRVMNVVKRDELGLTESDYEEMMELMDLVEQLPDFSDPLDANKPAKPILSNEEIEERQRRREVERLLAGAYGRPIPVELESLATQLLEHSRSYQPTELRRALPKLRDELVRLSLSPQQGKAEATSPPYTPPKYDPAMTDWTLYEVWNHQLERDKADTSSKGGQANHGGTLEERERRARVMTVLTQHKPVIQLSKLDWQTAYDAARRTKSGATASISPAPTPLQELLTDNPEQMTGHERVSALIASMKQIQNHARYLDLTSIRVDDVIIKPVQKRETERSRDGVPFSSDDIEAIFSGYIYIGAVPSDRTKAYPFWFWMPLVGYYTGARTNEIAQLDVADIREIEGYPCFDFCADEPKTPEAKRIKTGEARQVPIHPCLIDLGFLEFVDSQRQAKQKKLFGDGLTYLPPRDGNTEHNKEGWAKTAGKFFNEKPKGYLVTIGVHTPNDGKSIYSFRHTLETNLRNARRDGKPVDQSIIDAITGHAPDTTASKYYDAGATIQQKLDALMHQPISAAIERLVSYKVNFEDRFGDTLTKSVAAHRNKHRRIV